MVNGEIFYGCYWRIEKDDQEQAASLLRDALQADDDTEFFDMVDDLVTKNKTAHVLFNDGCTTVYYGIPLTTVYEYGNDLEEMAILRVMDLKSGSLTKEVREEMTKVMDSIPYALRDKFTPPKFSIAWGS